MEGLRDIIIIYSRHVETVLLIVSGKFLAFISYKFARFCIINYIY